MKTMCNQLCQEFMSDIVNVTSTTEDEEDSTALENYMLRDRGWVLLHVIYKSGVQVRHLFCVCLRENYMLLDLVGGIYMPWNWAWSRRIQVRSLGKALNLSSICVG